MAEGNGTGRMDRIERTLELLAEHQVKLEQNQEEFQRDLKQLLTAQVIQGDQLSELRKTVEENARRIGQHDREMAELRAHGKDIDSRIAALVSAIGQLISRPRD
jgi:septal ring factor EnvC (AmiA/AmiB activator)